MKSQTVKMPSAIQTIRFIIFAGLILLFIFFMTSCGSKNTNISLGMQQIQELQYQEALNSFEAAEELGENEKLIYRGRGIAYMGLTEYKKAVENLLQSLSYSDGWVEDVDYDINLYLAAAYTKDGKFTEAEKIYDAIIMMRSSDDDSLLLRGNVRLRQGNYIGAKEDFDQVIKLDSKNFDRMIEIFEVLDNYGYKDAGQGYLTDALQTYENEMSQYDKGRMYYYMGDYQKAYLALEEAKTKQGVEAYLYLGKAYEATGDYNYASSVYNSYLAKNAGDARIYNQLGICEMQKEQYVKALDAFQKGLELGDKSVLQSLQFNEIVAYEHMGEFQKATVLLESYLKNYPDDEKAKREYEFLSTR